MEIKNSLSISQTKEEENPNIKVNEKKYNLEGDNLLIINEKKPCENNNNIRREGKEEEIIYERMNNNADAKENEIIESNIIKKNSEIVDKESNNNIFINKNEIDSKTKILDVEIEEITEQVCNKNNKSFNENYIETKKVISYEKELNNDKERKLTKETKEKRICNFE